MSRGKRKRPMRSAMPTLAFVVDGETEVWYLQMLKRNERHIRFSIKPEIPNRKSVEDQYKLVCSLAEKEYERVFWIIDLDTVIKEEKERPKGKESPLKTLEKHRTKLKHKYKNVEIIINNPCLEFWFLLHFKKTTKYFHPCSSVEPELRRHLKSFEKTRKYFMKQNDDIYLKLKPYLKTAIVNSDALGVFDDENAKKAVCEMGKLFQIKEFEGVVG